MADDNLAPGEIRYQTKMRCTCRSKVNYAAGRSMLRGRRLDKILKHSEYLFFKERNCRTYKKTELVAITTKRYRLAASRQALAGLDLSLATVAGSAVKKPVIQGT